MRIHTVAVGGLHTLVCSDEGVAYSFGCGECGQLGHVGQANQHTPRVIEALRGWHISAVAAGGDHSLALSEAGALYSFGCGANGQLGHGDDDDDHDPNLDDGENQHTPRLVAALRGMRVSALAAGEWHSLVLSEAGDIYSFGTGRDGELGHGDLDCQSTPRPMLALRGVRMGAVAAGLYYSLMVSTAGRLYSCGYGEHGHGGHGDSEDHPTPRLVAGLEDVRVSAVAAGKAHCLALSEGKVYSFGSGTHGRHDHTPRVVAGLQGVRVCSVAAGDVTSLAVTAGGEVYGWAAGVRAGGEVYGWEDAGVDDDEVAHPMLGLELTEHGADQLVPCKYLGLRLRMAL